MGEDRILDGFLEAQHSEGLELSGRSDRVDLVPLDEPPCRRYFLRLKCTGLMRREDGVITQISEHLVGIRFPEDYLRSVNPLHVVTWLAPNEIFHPNILPPAVCLGNLTPGTGLLEVIFQLYQVVTYQKWATHDYLNQRAAEWARNNTQLFPVDTIPLKRRTSELEVSVEKGAESI